MKWTTVKVGLLLGLMSGCGKPPSKPFKSSPLAGALDTNPLESGQPVDSNGLPTDPASSIPMEASLAAFEANVYSPILGLYCANGCHVHNESFAPKQIGSADGSAPSNPNLEKAHQEFLKRVNFSAFADIDQTLPVRKMDYKSGGHNCWDPELKKCYDRMTEAVAAWLTDLKAVGYEPTPVQYPNPTEQVMFNSGAPVTVPYDAGDYVVGKIDTATLAAPFVMATDDPDGPIKTYATTPAGTAPLNAVNQAQSITFNMNVTRAAPYYAWARVKTPAGNQQRFFFNAPGINAPAQFIPGVTTDAWKWVRINVVQNNAAGENPLTFNLPVGAAAVRVFYREPQARINMVVITSRRDDFNGELFSNQFYDIKVPLTVPGVQGANIVATVWEQTTGEGKKSLGVKELRIESPVALRVKNIKPLINGRFYSNHATYTIVDTVAGGANPVIQTGGATSSIWVADKAVDKLSFSFEVLEVAQ